MMHALLTEIESVNLKGIAVASSGCAGLCSREPMVTVEIAGTPPVKYVDVDAKRIRRILTEHVLGGRILHECALAIGCERLG